MFCCWCGLLTCVPAMLSQSCAHPPVNAEILQLVRRWQITCSCHLIDVFLHYSLLFFFTTNFSSLVVLAFSVIVLPGYYYVRLKRWQIFTNYKYFLFSNYSCQVIQCPPEELTGFGNWWFWWAHVLCHGVLTIFLSEISEWDIRNK